MTPADRAGLEALREWIKTLQHLQDIRVTQSLWEEIRNHSAKHLRAVNSLLRAPDDAEKDQRASAACEASEADTLSPPKGGRSTGYAGAADKQSSVQSEAHPSPTSPALTAEEIEDIANRPATIRSGTTYFVVISERERAGTDLNHCIVYWRRRDAGGEEVLAPVGADNCLTRR